MPGTYTLAYFGRSVRYEEMKLMSVDFLFIADVGQQTRRLVRGKPIQHRAYHANGRLLALLINIKPDRKDRDGHSISFTKDKHSSLFNRNIVM
jgi:hypothetical protein